MNLRIAKSIKSGALGLFFCASLMLFGMPFGSRMSAHAMTEKDLSKDQIGLNAHWALGGFGADELFEKRLADSHTIWVREHFYYEVLMGKDQELWLSRYDKVMDEYKKLHIHVVGMLAYGPTHNDFHRPQDADWQQFVDLIARRYGNDVLVWEIWNEPDSQAFLTPNDPWNFKQLMQIGYDAIKTSHPEALVINGGLYRPDPEFAEVMLREYGNKFDALNVHVYECRQYFADGDFRQLDSEMDKLKSLVDKYKPGTKLWITELGCSTQTPGASISDQMQREYLEKATFHLLQKEWVERVLLYTIRNREINNPYEDNFGLLNIDMSPRNSWDFYAGIGDGPYGKRRFPIDKENAYATQLKDQIQPFIDKGYVTINKSQWPRMVQASLYGAYPIEAIIAATKNNGKTIHPTIPYLGWKQSDTYKNNIQVGIDTRRLLIPDPIPPEQSAPQETAPVEAEQEVTEPPKTEAVVSSAQAPYAQAVMSQLIHQLLRL